jgi:glycerate kinase
MRQRTVLVVAEAFGGDLDAAHVASSIGRGLTAGEPELEGDPCPIEAAETLPGDFDVRMRSSHAVIVAAGRLDHETLLRGGGAFEAATRARQAGVPCYAIAAHDGLDRFEARILDLQVVLTAGNERALVRAGRKLAEMV